MGLAFSYTHKCSRFYILKKMRKKGTNPATQEGYTSLDPVPGATCATTLSLLLCSELALYEEGALTLCLPPERVTLLLYWTQVWGGRSQRVHYQSGSLWLLWLLICGLCACLSPNLDSLQQLMHHVALSLTTTRASSGASSGEMAEGQLWKKRRVTHKH